MVFILLLVGLFIRPAAVQSKEPDIQDVTVSRTSEKIMLRFKVKNFFTPKTEEAILSGIPATFSFFINLYENRTFLMDKKIASPKVTRFLKYNSLTEEFRISFPEKNLKPTITTDFDTAKKIIREVEEVIDLSERLKKEGTYYIKIKAKLDSANLPFYLDYILFFVSPWDFETDWYTIKLDEEHES